MARPLLHCITLCVMIIITTTTSYYASAFVATRTKNTAKCNNRNNNNTNTSSNSAIRRIRGIQQPQQQQRARLYTSKLDDDIANDESNNTEEENTTQSKITSTATMKSEEVVQFGDVAPLKRPSSSPSSTTTATAAPQFGDVAPLKRSASSETTAAATAQFGEVMSLQNKPSTTAAAAVPVPAVPQEDNYEERIQQRRTKNILVAVVSILLALGNYSYQWTHPKTPIQLLVRMERASSPVSIIGTNNKPTVVDFWAPWCEQCRYMAPTLYQIEESYKDQVNFVSINGDDPQAWSMIEAFGVDAIPHLALVEYDGTVDTALIGPIQKHVLSEDLETLIANSVVSSTTQNGGTTAEKQPLPHQMLDVFANKPPEQRIVHFEAAVATEGTDAK